MIQLTVAYFKALKNESLQNTNFANIDNTEVRLLKNQNHHLYTFYHTIQFNQAYNRYMGGSVIVQTDSIPLRPDAEAVFSFDNYRYYSKKEYPANKFSAQKLELVVIDTVNKHFVFDQYLENIVFTDTSGLRNIRLDGTIRYDWEKWAGSAYFSDENEKIYISADLTFVNDNGDEVLLTTSENYIFTPRCGILKSGRGTFSFPNMQPDMGTLSYDNYDTCNIRGKMDMTDMQFYLTIDEWLMD
ncbi:MAG TPA: hypothetical protein PLC47_07685 [Bacteroidales bacterium]|nr:hypothetical protein [Bacteroidales bacterium]